MLEAMSDVTHKPQQHALGVKDQPEAERLEAAEFLVATRIQEDARRRIARAVQQKRQPTREQPAD